MKRRHYGPCVVRAHLEGRRSVVDAVVVKYARRNGVSAHEARRRLAEHVRRTLLAGPQLDGGR